MREIKFRAWDKQNKYVIEGHDITDIFAYFDIRLYPDRYFLMQYTDLQGKDATEFWEELLAN